jgi:hypothetical protein
MKRTVALISCGKNKRAERSAAKDLYLGELFKKTRALVEKNGQPFRILSALHGLVKPGQELDPYDFTLNGQSKVDKREWAERVVAELAKGDPNEIRFVIYAGRDYRDPLVPMLQALGFEVEIPLLGMEIGEQLSHLKKQLGA